MTKKQEIRLQEKGYFLYQGYHFMPVRQFTEKEGDFFEITKRLKRDVELGMMDADYQGKQKHSYSYDEFYTVSTDKKADIFFCLETMKEYVPCTHELQEYITEPKKQHDSRKIR